MYRLILRRLLQGIPLLFGVIVINFALMKLVPGSLLDVMTAEQQVTDPAMIDRLRHLYGLDQSAFRQLINYLWSVCQLDLGFSFRQNMPVLDVIMVHLPATLILMLASIALAVLVGVAAGVLAAIRVNSLWDSLISTLAVICFAAPSFWLGIMLIILFSVKLGWFPVGGMETIGLTLSAWDSALDILHHLALPAITLGLFYAATYARVMRASMLEIGQMDYVRTAEAKGLSRLQITLHHVLRNALLPVVTLLGLQLGTVLGGSVVIEAVFSWPGIGQVLFDSVMSRNYPLILGILVLSSLLVITINIVVDVVYSRLDPRVRSMS
ncbi:ABC transporter permease [Erwinia sp. OLTSP20]|uniref:ABC transporter permease n=1 Tax=unclassified Erwinia TaxID=2622719 RepID=UPI000C1A1728|nr:MULTISPECIES: ABC transporter permease [unclassified Erwinia]PIJ51732.1 ABC transporter permease [Erwinia sp. OAMSP11]PIJ75619.1 ABC transporter permease [Erwinia sp. OLSSP12]PIJ84924.1 ABC transporter permease [Erwinia sp. OLCASP19]PIJ86703.1 ABC transporter permease [Erwinia sp. OLMTSP26]PIJ88144.1 ABC transporter permease [Erwinia sp. OLMDSP33]